MPSRALQNVVKTIAHLAHPVLSVQVLELDLLRVGASAGCAGYCVAAEVVDCLGLGAHLEFGVGWRLAVG